MASNYSLAVTELVNTVVDEAQKVRLQTADKAALAILLCATAEVGKIIDPASPIGCILWENVLKQTMIKIGNTHVAYHKLEEAVLKPNPQK